MLDASITIKSVYFKTYIIVNMTNNSNSVSLFNMDMMNDRLLSVMVFVFSNVHSILNVVSSCMHY